uniref:Early nodulin-93 n=1 Tax=Aegilops tauschii TaxID=37682 RepID=M8CPU1_AEGTA
MSSTATVTRAHLENKLALAKRCSREATLAGAKAAAVATVASAVPTLASVRMLPWAKANLNPTGQALIVCTAGDGVAEAAMAGAKAAAVATVAAAVPIALIISTVAGMAYFVVADKTILSMARKHSFQDVRAPQEHLLPLSSL